MPRGVYDRSKAKPRVQKIAEVHPGMKGGIMVGEWSDIAGVEPPVSARRCDRCEAFEPGEQGRGLCMLNPEPVHKYGHLWCMQWREKK